MSEIRDHGQPHQKRNILPLWEAELRRTSCCKEEDLLLVSSRQTQLVGNPALLRSRVAGEVGTQRGRSVF